MANPDYLDPRWQKFRLEKLQSVNWKCEACWDSTNTLHVHHMFYISGRKPWEYLPGCTVVLCEECHTITHEYAADFEVLGPDRWERAASEARDVFCGESAPMWRANNVR